MRPLTQASCVLVRGFQVGETSGPRKVVSLRRLPPLESATQISGSPVREEEKATLEPSADQAGDRLLPPAVPPQKATRRPKSSEYMRMAHPSRPSEAKASRLLSGDTRGESEMLPK